MTSDTNDTGLIGDAPLPASVNPDLDATREEISSLLYLKPHYYYGKKVPIAYPSITHLDNYDNENENSHFVYLFYKAIEENKLKVYLRQLRFS